ncbi:DUF418 domain-containing protein [Streptomyces sp. SCSIO 30461]|uniref:DUF418 domain-containing protein n=1 Tax=Streptomyces sp. SCSIO 30461 TaxID=3118085 RepID=UPI0030CA70B6
MARREADAVSRPDAHPEGSGTATVRAASGGVSATGRLIGLDVARGLAVLGMFTAHLSPDPAMDGVQGWVFELARGRPATLFAVLAGFTLVILTGRPEPRTGRAGRQAMARVLIRSAVLIVLGYALTALDTPIDVILAAYGMLFVLALPLYRLSARALAAVAVVTALVMPPIRYLLAVAIDGGEWSDAVIALDPLARITDSEGFIELFVTGEYPVLTWIPFILTGMAVAKLDLTRRVLTRIATAGCALIVLGYGGSWLALHLVPGALPAVAAATDGGSAGSAWWSDTVGDPETFTPYWLLVAAPHSQTTWSILGSTGFALVVMALCFIAVDRSASFRWLSAPVAAVGSIALTAYTAHIIAIWALGIDDLDVLSYSACLVLLLSFSAVAMLFAMFWTRRFRRGPLEYLVYAATTPALLVA